MPESETVTETYTDCSDRPGNRPGDVLWRATSSTGASACIEVEQPHLRDLPVRLRATLTHQVAVNAPVVDEGNSAYGAFQWMGALNCWGQSAPLPVAWGRPTETRADTIIAQGTTVAPLLEKLRVACVERLEWLAKAEETWDLTTG